ncbi:MAG: UDP-N-acetylmuramate--L-alanine ligase [Vicinamibacteraceae bacterium]
MLGRTRSIHFVGIGGIGMSGIAELLANLGYRVSGSDLKASDVTRRLAELGVRIGEGHDASHVGAADVVVVSSAVRPDNVEVVEAHRRHIPVIPRAEMLAELMRLRYGVAVAGAHGKTTTTSMIAVMLERLGLDPTAVIGGRLSAFGSNARLGRGEYMVAEADESDGSFLKLSPVIAVITNVDREHLDYYGSFDAVLEAFVTFANKVPFYGVVVLGADDQALRALMPRVKRRVVTYALDRDDVTLRGVDARWAGTDATCTVVHRPRDEEAPRTLGELRVRLPGRHNVANALAAVAVGLELGLAFERAAGALAEFRGAERRFQVLGSSGDVTVVDDYGHHPTEIRAVLEAARTAWPQRRLVVVFQPHRYTRTAALLDDFGATLAAADEILLVPIYAAGEDPIEGLTVQAVAEAVRRHTSAPVDVADDLEEVAGVVARRARPGDVVITLGAGSIGTSGPRILQALADRAA